MNSPSKPTNQHSSAAFYGVGTALGVIVATTMFFSNNLGFSSVIASTTIQNDNENQNSSDQFDTSKIELGTGDYAFQSTDDSVVQINGNSFNSSFVTNVKNVNGSVIYSESSQFISIYNTGEDLSGATYTITNTSNGAVITSGRFTQVNVGSNAYYALCLPSSVIHAGFDAAQTSQGKLHTTIANGSTKTSYPTILNIKTMASTASIQLPTVTGTEDNQKASTHFKGQTGTIVDANNQKIGSVSLGSSDITVAQDGIDPKEYTYSLSNSGIGKVNTALNTINQKALISGGLYYTADTSSTGNISITPAAPDKATLTIKYVDEQGKTVKTDTVNGNIGDKGNYTVKTPTDYALADGQNQTSSYTLANSTDQLTIKLKKVVQPQAASLTINYTNANGVSVKTDTVNGNVGDQGTYMVSVPNGYALATEQNKTVPYTLSSSNTPININVDQVSNKQQVTQKVNYIDENGKIIKTDTINGLTGDSGSYSPALPSGYRLVNNKQASIAYTLTTNATPLSIAIQLIRTKSPVVTSNRAHLNPAFPIVPSHSAANVQKTLPESNTTMRSKNHLSTATIMYIDGATGRTLGTEILTGKIGERIVFDTYKQIFSLQRAGYYIVRDDTMRFSAAYFTNAPTTYRVVLEQSHSKKETAGVGQTPRTSDTTKKHTKQSEPITNASSHHNRDGHKRRTNRTKKQEHNEPVIFDKEIDAILASSGRGGGNDEPDISELGKFFISLSGTINFGIRNN
ncbi:mucin-binding protein [Lacticaseibacillus pantheris]|uniref:mucin-binding protein n=1 Tax=Lacticaseibacillus pantheris TaxID=171523 RepID=UPI002658436C|nr:MucBP domain-containing protein [Lacticaseibacillus pantheris]WKF85120.1 MucBP domain-containing protein [Lacticaseibacillus pantheris]